MNRKYGTAMYTTRMVEDTRAGSIGLELYREKNEKTDCMARILFWDATGQYGFEMFNGELPLDIVEQLINETKEAVKIK